MILAFETSTPEAEVCLYNETTGEVVWSESFTTQRSHNSVIFSSVEKALEICDRELSGIAVGLGPGSYSGVRVGIAVAQGLSISLKVPVVGVSSLEAYSDSEDSYIVVGDARRKTRFVAKMDEGKLQGEPELIPEEEFLARLSEPDTVGKKIYTPDASVIAESDAIFRGRPLAKVIANRFGENISKAGEERVLLEPHYLRPPFITTPKPKGKSI